MRKSSPIDPLINKTTQGLLAATVLQPDRWWYLSDLAKHLRRRPSSLQTPLAALVSAGILSRRKEGNRVYFPSESGLPVLAGASGADGQDGRAGRGASGGPRAAEGSAGSGFRPRVGGKIQRGRCKRRRSYRHRFPGACRPIARSWKKAEERLGRPVNASVYSPQEFAKKLAAKNHFLCSVLDKEKLFVVGEPNDLERIAGRKAR